MSYHNIYLCRYIKREREKDSLVHFQNSHYVLVIEIIMLELKQNHWCHILYNWGSREEFTYYLHDSKCSKEKFVSMCHHCTRVLAVPGSKDGFAEKMEMMRLRFHQKLCSWGTGPFENGEHQINAGIGKVENRILKLTAIFFDFFFCEQLELSVILKQGLTWSVLHFEKNWKFLGQSR